LKLEPAHLLWKLYKPEKAQYRFSAETVSQARIWQKKTLKVLENKLGFQDHPLVSPQPKIIEEVDKKEYIRQKVIIQTTRYSAMPVYLLIPKVDAKPMKTVLAFHGHGYGVKDIVGLRENGRERNASEGYQKDFAVELCRQGFIVAAPEIACFGERITDFSHLNKAIDQAEPTTCSHSAALASHLGFTILGFRLYEMKRLIDYLTSRNEFDVSRMGVMGISGGGMLAFFLAALEKRIKASVISGYFCTFKDSILAMEHCSCNFVPGLAQFGEMYDLAGLIAPRPMLVEAGSHDGIFPINAVKRSVKKARAIYRIFDTDKSLETDFFVGPHQINGAKAYDFLSTELSE
jgi:dienelactone hydrolase